MTITKYISLLACCLLCSCTPSAKEKNLEIDVAIVNATTNELAWVEVEGVGDAMDGVFAPKSRKSSLFVRWPYAGKAQISIKVDSNSVPQMFDVDLAGVNEQLRKGTYKVFKLTIVSGTNAVVSLE